MYADHAPIYKLLPTRTQVHTHANQYCIREITHILPQIADLQAAVFCQSIGLLLVALVPVGAAKAVVETGNSLNK